MGQAARGEPAEPNLSLQGSLRKACGLVTCPLLFFTASPCLLLSTPHCCFLNLVGLVPICRCKGGKFMSFRGSFGLVHFSFTLSSSEGFTCDRTSTCLSLQGW